MREAGPAGAAGGIQRDHVRVRAGNPRLGPGRRRAAVAPRRWREAGYDLSVVVPAERLTSTIAQLAQDRARAGTHVATRSRLDGSRIGPRGPSGMTTEGARHAGQGGDLAANDSLSPSP